MSGNKKWSEIVAKRYPEVINARFPAGTKARIKALADRTMMEIAAQEHPELEHVPTLLSPSVIVRRAVLDYLDREESLGGGQDGC